MQICESVADWAPVGGVGVVIWFFGWIQIVIAVGIYFWHRRLAKRVRNDANDVTDIQRQSEAGVMGQFVLLPIYSFVLLMFAVADFYYGVITLLVLHKVLNPISVVATILYGLAWGCFHFCIEGLASLLLEPGAGLSAARRVMRRALCWGVMSWAFVAVWTHLKPQFPLISLLVQCSYEAVLLCFYATIYFAPTPSLFRRPAAPRYALFWIILRSLMLLQILLHYFAIDLGGCVSMLVQQVMFTCKPFLVFHVLLQDSLYWQGLAPISMSLNFSRALHKSYNNKHKNKSKSKSKNKNHKSGRPKEEEEQILEHIKAPLLGTFVPKGAARSLAENVEKLGEKSIISYALIALEKEILGAGGTAKVYRGIYKAQRVAVKMIFCLELTPVEIEKFVREASTLATLSWHPNVVSLYGTVISPPSICLVMELCDYGSLYDILYSAPAGSRLCLPLNLKRRLLLAWQCAKGVECLHSRQPPLLHLDLKSSNFLVARSQQYAHLNCEFEAKVSDLELVNTEQNLSMVQHQSDAQLRFAQTINWTAPEILQHGLRDVTSKSDCYSLGMVLYELISGVIPFDGIKFNSEHERIALTEDICKRGLRPPIPPDCPPRYAALLRKLWAEDPDERVTAEETVLELQAILMDLKDDKINELMYAWERFKGRPEFQNKWNAQPRSRSGSAVSIAIPSLSQSQPSAPNSPRSPRLQGASSRSSVSASASARAESPFRPQFSLDALEFKGAIDFDAKD